MPRMIDLSDPRGGKFWRPGASAGGGPTEYGMTTLGETSVSVNNYQVGWEFTVGVSNLTLAGARLYISTGGNGGDRELLVWDVAGGTLVDSGTLPGGFAIGEWHEVSFSGSNTLSSGSNYIVSTYNTAGSWSYSYKQNPESSGYTFNSAISFVQGRFQTSGTISAFPTGTNGNVFGICDIIFTT